MEICPKWDEVVPESGSTRDKDSTMLRVWCFGFEEDGVMKEKFFLAIVITFSLSCLQNWSVPTAGQIKDSMQTQTQHLARAWNDEP